METLEPPGSASSDTEQEPHFLLVRDSSGDWPRWKRAAAGTAIFHVIALTALFLITGDPYQLVPPDRLSIPYVTHLYIPKDLTQKAPNKGPVAKQLMAPAVAPTPKLSEPAPKAAKAPPPAPPPAPKPQPQTQAPKPQQQAPVAAPPPAPAPVAQTQTPATTPPPAPIAVPKPEQPKMIIADSLQAPTAPKPANNLGQGNPIQEAMRSLSNGGASSQSNRVGDSDDLGAGAGLRLPLSQPKPQSSLQLKSDPMGVDFKPYLLQVLQAVRTNWFAVYPEAARLGSRGRVGIEFAVNKSGMVTKVVFAGQSGSRALDQAAVAAISASSPLPPLPKDFKGDNIVLAMSFLYNMPR